jgi:hypothetical protein
LVRRGCLIATVFEFAQKLDQFKDFQELVRIQTEFLQTQTKLLTEQQGPKRNDDENSDWAFKGISS